MTRLIAILLSLTVLSQPAFADQAVDLKKDDRAPYDGVLLDKEKSTKVKNDLIEKDGLAQLNESYKKSVLLYKGNEDLVNQKSDLLLKQNIELTGALNDTRKMSDWTKVGYFFLGVVITGAAFYGASRIAK